jgi:hypothetical protein
MGINSLLLTVENESWSYATMLIDTGVNIEQADEVKDEVTCHI